MLIENTSKQLVAIHFESPFQQVLQQHGFLLRSFNKKNKWQLWLSERPMLKRAWINIVGLDKKKVVRLSNMKHNKLITIIEKALLSQTCSYIVACVNGLNDNDKQRLAQASLATKTPLFLVDEVNADKANNQIRAQYH